MTIDNGANAGASKTRQESSRSSHPLRISRRRIEHRPDRRSLRRLLFGLFIAGFASPVLAQGVIPIALQQEITANGQPMAGALLYTFVVGTVSSQQATYQDSGLTITNRWPLVADQNGRIPMFYMANGSTHVRLTDSTGVVQFDYPSMLVIGASGGSSSGGSVDPTTIMATGFVAPYYGTGTRSGFVRANGLTIGSAVSGATERANADTQNLFVYLHGADPNLVVSGGRTGNALNDYNSNKTIALPDWRGMAIGALTDMGNSATTLLTSTYFGTTPTTLGASGGSQSLALAMINLPASPAPVSATTSGYSPTVGGQPANGVPNGASQLNFNTSGLGSVYPSSQYANIAGFASLSVSSNTANLGSGTPAASVGPMKLLTLYMKL
jgi:hypothetical protein